MPTDDRASGGADVREELYAEWKARKDAERRRVALRKRVCHEYLKASSEDDLQATLCRELQHFGWNVRREVHCWASASNRRRIDLYATATQATEDATGVVTGTTVGLELKYDGSLKCERDAYLQVIGYASAFCWFDEATDTHLPAPMFLGVASGPMLDGSVKDGGVEMSRVLWQYGAGYLSRPWDANLRLQVRRPKVQQRKNRAVVTTSDGSLALTAWGAQ